MAVEGIILLLSDPRLNGLDIILTLSVYLFITRIYTNNSN